MTEPEPDSPGSGPDAAAGDALAARLLAAQRLLSALNVEAEVRVQLHLRFMAICTALKMPGASLTRGAQRLDQLMADAERAQAQSSGMFE
ncbi:MAG TPA: hypothetical protein VNF47_07790 [Streptosporangiaceae bacterium]|nr:hypothetical protein [Streptosporangiaceae bacterium]